MKKWISWMLICTVIGSSVIFFFIWMADEKNKAEHPQNEVTHGVVSIYDEDGQIYYQYAGHMEINIQDDEGEVIIHLPSTDDSCFDDEGNLLP